jgi:uncharacterized peroxidase-related enzyme
MSRLPTVDPSTASGATKELLNAVEKKLGVVPNMMRTMALSPAVLDGYLQFSGALAKSSLSAKVREQIALAVGEVNSCEYCLAAHTTIGGKLGLAASEVDAARHGVAKDPKVAAILAFARELVLRRGEVKDADLRVVRQAGVSDPEIAEIVASVALNVFTNWFNHVADPVVDFPAAKPLAAASAAI